MQPRFPLTLLTQLDHSLCTRLLSALLADLSPSWVYSSRSISRCRTDRSFVTLYHLYHTFLSRSLLPVCTSKIEGASPHVSSDMQDLRTEG